MLRFLRLAAVLLPGPLRPAARRLYRLARAALLRGSRVECPVCGGRFRHFLPAGDPPRPGAECPRCGALERHRLLWLFLARETGILSGSARLLHFAPEPALVAALRREPGLRCVTIDLSPGPRPNVLADAVALPLPGDAFDAVLCIHVLEHVPDDGAAIREIFRVLRPGGLALVMSPSDPLRDRSFEDPRAHTPEERRRLFGQADHVRIYGRDLPGRLAGAGFAVQEEKYAATLSPEVVARHGLRLDHVIYRCARPA